MDLRLKRAEKKKARGELEFLLPVIRADDGYRRVHPVGIALSMRDVLLNHLMVGLRVNLLLMWTARFFEKKLEEIFVSPFPLFVVQTHKSHITHFFYLSTYCPFPPFVFLERGPSDLFALPQLFPHSLI